MKLLAWLGLTLLVLLLALPAAADDPLYFQDDFSAGSGQKFFYEGNLDERSFGYRDGGYQIDTRRSTAYGQSVLTENLDSYRLEANCQLNDTKDANGGGFGLSFNYREAPAGSASAGSDFLLFLVYDRGAYSVLRYLDGRTSVLYAPTKTKLFKAGEPVQLMVDVRKGQIRCFINGGEVASIHEDTLRSGGFGLFATAQSLVRFDDFKVYAPGGAGGSTAQPGPVAGGSGFKDDFAGPKALYEGTYNEVSYGYSGGRYVIDTQRTKYIGLSPFPQQALNFEFSADVELLEGDSNSSYGIYFRDYPSSTPDKPGAFSQFRFLVSNGWFAVEQSIEDRPLALAEWTQSPSVTPGLNRLKVVADGGSLTFFVNGRQVYTFLDARPHSGEFGMFVSAGIKVAFDNAEFTKLP
jgi:hypothetical protein